jgi:hypothetical protein
VSDDIDRPVKSVEQRGQPLGIGVLARGEALRPRRPQARKLDSHRVPIQKLQQRTPDLARLREPVHQNNRHNARVLIPSSPQPPLRHPDADARHPTLNGRSSRDGLGLSRALVLAIEATALSVRTSRWRLCSLA